MQRQQTSTLGLQSQDYPITIIIPHNL